ncbi:hypothetical protein G8A07_00690 [Roseateles sp. DAIF2]|uniref:hypothetical protein n=1 Tax=Roseateles sp. DAIF2 TaxID=2714952 RepID=UPI0018A31868|nr:hypothetical protein [Roseateles sp. DAIF2]QPF71583.1 hypothetical protein G8A07_00690 [Roseateles sp. DAIF2]
MFQFFSYCEHVAAATGRTEENASPKAHDDGGLNAFQREQYRMLRSGEFVNGGDPAIVARGAAIASKLRNSFWAAVALVFSVAVAELWAK